jgi:phage tail-like protein
MITGYPYPSYNFTLNILPFNMNPKDCSFQEISGLNATVQTETVKEGGTNSSEIKLPTGISWDPIVCKRGVMGSSALMNWVEGAMSFVFLPMPGVINLKDNSGKILITVWAMEQSLYFPGLYSGTTDGIGVFEGEPCVFDHKQTNKPKKAEWVDDYYMQLCAYILAHNEVYGTNIRRGVVFMCSRDLQYQQFDLLPENFNMWQDRWLSKVEEYYTTVR